MNWLRVDGCPAGGRTVVFPLAGTPIHYLKGGRAVATKAQQVYERVEALIAEGVKKADAFRQLAEEFGQPVKSVQGAYYQHARKGEGGRTRPRKRETTPTDAVESAKAVLEQAIEQIDAEIEAARERAEEAQAEYEPMEASASERKQAIQAKLAALDS